MSIIRVKRKRHNFAQIDTTPLRDKSLSWKARGILAFLMTKPDDWQVNECNLIKESEKDGRDSLRSGIRELKDSGYVAKIFIKDASGLIVRWETIVFETVEDREDWIEENPCLASQLERSDCAENQWTGFPPSGETSGRENQWTGFPPSGKPDAIHINEITNDRLLEINEERERSNSPSLAASQESKPEQPAIALPETETTNISLASNSSGQDQDVPPSQVEAVSTSRYSDPRYNSVARFHENFNTRTVAPKHPYPDMVREGLGHCWIGPKRTDFDPWLVKAQLAFRKATNQSAEEGLAKNTLANYVRNGDWASLETRWDDAVKLKEQFEAAESRAIASRQPVAEKQPVGETLSSGKGRLEEVMKQRGLGKLLEDARAKAQQNGRSPFIPAAPKGGEHV